MIQNQVLEIFIHKVTLPNSKIKYFVSKKFPNLV